MTMTMISTTQNAGLIKVHYFLKCLCALFISLKLFTSFYRSEIRAGFVIETPTCERNSREARN